MSMDTSAAASLNGAQVICTACGAVHDNPRDLPGVKELMASRDETVEILLAEQRKDRRRIGLLEQQRADRQNASPFAHDAQLAFDHWNAVCMGGRAREFNGKRQAAVIARLEAGHPLELINRASDGAAARPYVTDAAGRSSHGRPDQRQVDLELVCRSEAHLQRFASYVEVEEAPGQPESSEPAAPAAGKDGPSPAPPEPEWPTFNDWVDQAMDRRRALIEGLTPDPVALERRSFLLAHAAGFWRARKAGVEQLRLAA